MGKTTVKSGVLAAITAALVFSWAPLVAAEVSDSMSAADIEQLLSEAGLGGKILEDKGTGAPVALGKMGEISFVVRAMDCGGSPIACKRLLFFANFDLNRDVSDTDFRIVNDFNEAHFDGRAYVIENTNQMGVDYFIDLTGGVTSDHISSRLSRWRGVVNTFLKDIRSASTGS